MRQLRIVLWLAVIFAGTAFGQGAKTVPAASAPQAQASTQTTVAAMVDRDISAVEKQVVEATEAMPEEKFNFTRDLEYSRRRLQRGSFVCGAGEAHCFVELFYLVANYRRSG